jgi:biotin carboxyl carrier protein
MDVSIYYKQKEKKISITRKDGKYIVLIGDKKVTYDAELIDSHTLSLLQDNLSIRARIVDSGPKKSVYINGIEYLFEDEREKETDYTTKGKSKVLENIIKSPMPGSVVKLNVGEGDSVKEGDILIIVEAMKMENELRSSGNLKVKKIYVKEGDQVEGFAPLIELE